jgi:hypothetical protein
MGLGAVQFGKQAKNFSKETTFSIFHPEFSQL